MQFKVIGFSVVAAMGLTRGAHAIVIEPGKTVNIPSFDGLLEGTFQSQKTHISDLKDASGAKVGRAGVFTVITKRAGGKLNFYYVVLSFTDTPNPIVRLGTAAWTGCSADIFSDQSNRSGAPVGGPFPTVADRSADGKFLNFTFENKGGKDNRVQTNEYSNRILAKTDATEAMSGTAGIRDSKNNVAYVEICVPKCVVPEPGTWLSLGLGMAVAVRMRRSR